MMFIGNKIERRDMTDTELTTYAQNVYDDIYAISIPMIDGMAAKVLTRLRKEQRNLFPIKEEWKDIESMQVDVMDILTILAHKDVPLGCMHKDLEAIIDQYILDRYNNLESKTHFFVTYRYIDESNMIPDVKERIYARLLERYGTQRYQKLLERYPDLTDFQV